MRYESNNNLLELGHWFVHFFTSLSKNVPNHYLIRRSLIQTVLLSYQLVHHQCKLLHYIECICMCMILHDELLHVSIHILFSNLCLLTFRPAPTVCSESRIPKIATMSPDGVNSFKGFRELRYYESGDFPYCTTVRLPDYR